MPPGLAILASSRFNCERPITALISVDRMLKPQCSKVKSGHETEIVLRVNSAPDYQEKLSAELKVIRESEMWRAGAIVRDLRPERGK